MVFRICIEDLARFWSKVDVKSSQAECWEWRASTFPNGYGQFTLKGRPIYAHRFAWWHQRGGVDLNIDSVTQVCHRCDNRKCCNPYHLFTGTAHDNVRDCIVKGRRAPGRQGEKSNFAKLNAEKVKEIRAKHATRTYTYQKLADEYGITQGNVGQIVKRKTWNHVQDVP